MTLTLELPDELVSSLHAVASKKKIDVNAFAKQEIERGVDREMADEHFDETRVAHLSPEERETIRRVWQTLREANYPAQMGKHGSTNARSMEGWRELQDMFAKAGPAPSDEEVKKMIDEHLMEKYGAGITP